MADLVSLTSKPELVPDKASALLFNGCRYRNIDEISNKEHVALHDGAVYPRRITENLQVMQLLVLDIDNSDQQQEMYTLEKAKQDFSAYIHIGYTSYSHTNERHKFRIILPLAKPIPMNDGTPVRGSTFDQLADGLKARFPHADPASFRPNQMFFLPSATVDSKDRFTSWVNHGELFDWSQLPIRESAPSNPETVLQRQKRFISNKYLEPDQVLTHARGHIHVRDIKTRIQKVRCPFHNDRRGSEFVNVTRDGVPFLHCKRCAKTYYMRDPDRPDWLNNRLTEEYRLGIDDPYDQSIALQYAGDRTKVNETLSKILKKITGPDGVESKPWGKQPYSHFICLPEGSGKSRLVIELAKQGYTTVFAAKSYEQLQEKYREFSQEGNHHGFKVEILESVDGIFQRLYGCKVIRKPTKNPYALGAINTDATIAEVLRLKPEANEQMVKLRLAWYKASRYKFPSADPQQDVPMPTRIVLMTFTMMRVLPSLNCWPDDGTIIWYDDPDQNDLIDIAPKSDESIDNNKLISEQYFLRPQTLSLGNKTKNYCQVITTTERICMRLAEKLFVLRKENHLLHDDMHNVDGGKITVLGTKFVQKKLDGLIPVLLASLESKHPNTVLISNGLSTKLNHSNSKGKNNLTGFNTVIEISCPHPTEINTLCQVLEIDPKADRRAIERDCMLDKMHQALGRNSGYRNTENTEAVVLVDPGNHEMLVRSCRYRLDIDNSVIIDRLKSMSRLNKRTSQTATPLVANLEHAINNPEKILFDGRIGKPTIKRVISRIEDHEKLAQYIFRLTLALSTLGEYSALKPPTQPNDRQRKLLELSHWIMDEFADTAIKKRVGQLHTEYQRTLKASP